MTYVAPTVLTLHLAISFVGCGDIFDNVHSWVIWVPTKRLPQTKLPKGKPKRRDSVTGRRTSTKMRHFHEL